MLEKLASVFFPSVCPICGKIPVKGQKICEECRKDIVIISEPKCIRCGKPLVGEDRLYCSGCERKKHSFEKGVAVFEYSGAFRESMYRFKYDNCREYADFYAGVAARIYGEQFREWKIDAVVPVPIHKEREIKRGYNQSGVFAETLVKYTGLRLENKLLIRKKKTVPQKELTEEIRYRNLKDAFAVDRDRMRGIENILLVDDIYTTGSTVDACSLILKKAGAKRVYVLCISAGRNVESCRNL